MKIKDNEKIRVYGAAHYGEKFYLAYKDKYSIVEFIDRNSDREFFGIPVKKIEEIGNLKEYKIIVTTSPNVYEDVSNTLQKYGLRENEDFCYVDKLNKKKAILYGNCHVILHEFLIQNEDFHKNYYIEFI